MNVEASFAFAAIVISVLILYYYYRLNKVKNTQGAFFVWLVVDNTLTALSSYMRWAVDKYVSDVPDMFYYAMSYIYFITHTVMIVLIFLYIFSNVRSWREMPAFAKAFVIVPVSLALIFIATNPLHQLVYSYDGNIYRRESGIIVVYITFIYYFISTLFVVIWFNKSFSNKGRTVVLTILGIGLASVVIQLLLPEMQVEVFAIALSELILFLFIQNPTEQIDAALGTYSKTAFSEKMRDNIISRRRFDLIVLDIRSYRDYEAKHEKGGRPLMKAVAYRLRELASDIGIYKVAENTLAIEIIRPKAREATELISRVEADMDGIWDVEGEKVSLQGHLLKLCMPGDISDYEQLQVLIERFRNKAYESRCMSINDFDMQSLDRYRHISGALARVIDKKQFEIRYTPVYSMALSRVIGGEIAVRFYDDELGYVYNDEIFSYAERSGHALQLGQLIFEDVCSFISEHRLSDLGLSFLLLELMPDISMQPSMYSKLKGIADRYRVDPKIFCLQVTERTVSRATPTFRENINEMNAAGIRFCLEDYGSGFTNIASIYEMPFSILMVNQAVMHAAMGNEKARITMDSTLTMARDLSMMTMVAGINDEKMFGVISDMAVDFAIGNYFFEQLDGEEFLKVARLSAEERDGGENI
ncbi:MAG: EAL domain-containing protein [Lachnospiraceae bacterium]|nr:EAL domain-containing protein [Lachnospiraceae bacterium]